jgi:uncharacterized damage-inducible protein DinB
MTHTTRGLEFLKEMQAEAKATRKCLERMRMELSDYKPHEKSMKMGYLALILADIPKWISHMVEIGDIDFATWEHFQAKTTEELVSYFDKNMEHMTEVLKNASDEALEATFSLKNNGQVLVTDVIGDSIGSSINHLVHHRGQITVYMRLNDIPVPSLYGPSADDQSF